MQDIDISLFHFINQTHNPFVDALMHFISLKWTWIPLYLLAIYFIQKKENTRNTLLFLACIILSVGLADILASSLLKPLVQRPRPCHEEAYLPFEARTIDGCGGKYGFASSHAANFMAMAIMLSLLFKEKKASILFFLCALAVGYSRIYLGVHYPSDILGGFIIGGLTASLGWYLYQKLHR